MILQSHPGCHLTYCSNIHSGEEWIDHFRQLKLHLPEIKQRVSPDAPFGVGLRLSAKAAKSLKKPESLVTFKHWLSSENLYLFTINGFPYGSFHGERVKDNVYAPDWTQKARLDYTLDLAEILAELVPEGMDGGISTSPLSYKYWEENPPEEEIRRISTRHLAEVAHKMADIEKNDGKELHLDIEPEPDCLLENSAETIDFFTRSLFPDGSSYLESKYGYNRAQAEEILHRHIRVCYDTCHFALEYENPHKAIANFIAAGIRIGKTQMSAALKINLGNDPAHRKNLAEKLRKFDEPVYLHQVIEKRNDGTYKQFRDLPQAIEHIVDIESEEWRIHFHVPVFINFFDEMSSTQDHILESIGPLLNKAGCKHFEVETYTWEVLPEHLKADITDSIERELNWTLKAIEERG